MVAVVVGAGLALSQPAAGQVLTPNSGAQQGYANTAGQTAVFALFNNTGTSTVFNLNPCIRTGSVTACSSPATIFVPSGTTMNFNVTFTTGSAGSGTVRVVLTSAIDDAQYTITVVAGNGVAVTPDAVTRVKPPNTSGHTENFSVTNTGTASNTFSFACSGTGGVTCGTLPGPVTLAAGAQTTVSMPYSVGAPGNGALLLTVTGTGAGDAGSLAVTIGGVVVTPASGTSVPRQANTGGHSEVFAVHNLGVSNTFTFACNGFSGVTCGTVPSPLSLGQGAQANVTMPYSVGSAGQGILILTAFSSGSVSATGQVLVPIVTYGVTVTPDGATAPERQTNTGGYLETFTVLNTGSATNTYSFGCLGTGGVTCGTLPAPVTIGSGAQMTVDVPYSVGAVGTGTLTLTATGTGSSNAGSYSVPITFSNVTVTPNGGTANTRFSSSSGYSEAFDIKNTGGGSNTFTVSCNGTGGVICGTPPGPVTLSAGIQTVVTMPYTTGGAVDGVLTLTATGTNATDNGWYNVAIARSLTWTTGGVLTRDSHYLLQETVTAYDTEGRLTRVVDATGFVTKYQYGGPGSAYLTKVTDSADASGSIDLVTDLGYDANGYVSSLKDPGGSFRYFTYDGFGRLRRELNHSSSPVRAHGYSYSRTSGNGWVFQPSSPNAVVDSTFLQVTPTTQVVVSTSYLDGLGAAVQAVTRDGNSYYVSATQYDAMRRTWRQWRPYTRATAGYDPNFAANAAAEYTTYHGTAATPYVETVYRPDPLDRVSKVFPEYLGTSRDSVVTRYGLETATSQTINEVRDESGKLTRTHRDLFSNVVKSILGYGAAEATSTTLAYDVLGQRRQVTDPRGLVTTYTLDTRGLLTARTSPDAGTVNSKYSQAGQLRFTQDANQAAGGQVYFINYDFAGRPRTSGLGTATFSSLSPDVTESVETIQGNWLAVRSYDAKPSTGSFPWTLFSTQITPLTLSNVGGRLAAVASKSGAAWQVTLFSYDADGQVATRYTYTQNPAGSAVLTAVNTTIGYVRDLRGAVTQRTLTAGSSTFYEWYDYDARGLLWKLYASTTSTKPGTPDVTDTYRPDGMPKDYQFQGGPLVPLRYTIRGRTDKIGDPALTTYPFSAQYTYNPNGTVSVAEFYSQGSPAAQKRYRYAFPTYDALNRLKAADFSSWSGSAWTSTLAYDLAGINYDAAGNLTALQRYRETATLLDNLTYTYPGTSHRLTSVTEAAGASAETWDAETGAFTYDASGNLLTAPAPYSITATSYNHQHLPLSLTRSGTNHQAGGRGEHRGLPPGGRHHTGRGHPEFLRHGAQLALQPGLGRAGGGAAAQHRGPELLPPGPAGEHPGGDPGGHGSGELRLRPLGAPAAGADAGERDEGGVHGQGAGRGDRAQLLRGAVLPGRAGAVGDGGSGGGRHAGMVAVRLFVRQPRAVH